MCSKQWVWTNERTADWRRTRNADSAKEAGMRARMSATPAMKAEPSVEYSIARDRIIWYGPDHTICRYGAASWMRFVSVDTY